MSSSRKRATNTPRFMLPAQISAMNRKKSLLSAWRSPGRKAPAQHAIKREPIK